MERRSNGGADYSVKAKKQHANFQLERGYNKWRVKKTDFGSLNPTAFVLSYATGRSGCRLPTASLTVVRYSRGSAILSTASCQLTPCFLPTPLLTVVRYSRGIIGSPTVGKRDLDNGTCQLPSAYCLLPQTLMKFGSHKKAKCIFKRSFRPVKI